MEIDRLIDKLISVVMKYTGATKCLLVLEKGGELFVKAQAVVNSSGTEVDLLLSSFLHLCAWNSTLIRC